MKQQHVVLIGASGFVGSAILKEALERGHKVTAIVRSPAKIKIQHPDLTVKKTDIMDREKLTEALKGADAVISAYNPGWKNPNIADDTIKGYGTIIESVKDANVSRLLIVGGAGSLYVKKDIRVMDTPAIDASILPAVKALASILYNLELNEHKLKWTFFSPAAKIYPGERTGKYQLGAHNLIVDSKGESSISVEDYAVAMIDELEEPKHTRKRFTIGY